MDTAALDDSHTFLRLTAMMAPGHAGVWKPVRLTHMGIPRTGAIPRELTCSSELLVPQGMTGIGILQVEFVKQDVLEWAHPRETVYADENGAKPTQAPPFRRKGVFSYPGCVHILLM